jgi:hypothetical protein
MLARQGARTGPAGLKRNLCNRTRLAALAAPPEAPVTVVNRRAFPSMLPPTGDKATEMTAFSDGLWVLSQQFGAPGAGMDIKVE